MWIIYIILKYFKTNKHVTNKAEISVKAASFTTKSTLKILVSEDKYRTIMILFYIYKIKSFCFFANTSPPTITLTRAKRLAYASIPISGISPKTQLLKFEIMQNKGLYFNIQPTLLVSIASG